MPLPINLVPLQEAMVTLLGALVAVSALSPVHAFWRMDCPGRTGLARLDPIVSPGSFSSHAHAVHGSSGQCSLPIRMTTLSLSRVVNSRTSFLGFSQTSLTKDLLAGSCTSCQVKQDKSAYWHPALYFEDANTGQYELVNQIGGLSA